MFSSVLGLTQAMRQRGKDDDRRTNAPFNVPYNRVPFPISDLSKAECDSKGKEDLLDELAF